MLSRRGSTVTLSPPATVGNFGPGFDAASLALAGAGDRITVTPTGDDAIRVAGPGADGVPTDWRANVAGRCLDRLRETTGVDTRFTVELDKPRAPGTGLGSSASSSAGAALAFHALEPEAGLTPADLVQAAGRAESAAGQAHFDDVAAVVLGGFAIVQGGPDGLEVARVDPPDGMVLALAVPRLARETDEMRDRLPEKVARSDAVVNLSALARLVDALHEGDVAAVGACLVDRLAVPHRTRDLDFYHPARRAALEAGAHGAVLSGSGPSIVAVLDDEANAKAAADAMAEAIREHGVAADAFTAHPEREVPYDVATMR